jgi:hypothetical protein
MITLASKILDAEVITAQEKLPSFLEKLSSVLKKRPANGLGKETCLLICAGPSDLVRLLSIDDWRGRFQFLAAWVIDSFWVEFIPPSTRLSKPFDHFFVTTTADVDQWEKATGVPTTWLPWGTDALALGTGRSKRDWDLSRLGRQPPEWDNDEANFLAARAHNISYRGRVPGGHLAASQNQELVMRLNGNSKYVLAFSNVANPESYTHPTKHYLTGRWVDALASGAVVAGIAPRGPDADRLLWEGATLELGSIRQQKGLELIADALKDWTPEYAARNHLMALKRLDWRWRFETIARIFSTETATLRNELQLLGQLIDQKENVINIPAPLPST